MKTKTNRLPISKKAYDDFSSRLTFTFSCLPDAEENVRLAIELLDAYITGDVTGLYEAPQLIKIAFSILAPEIDRAIERSRRARARAGVIKGNDRIVPGQSAKETESGSKIERKSNVAYGCHEKPRRREIIKEKGGKSLISAIVGYVGGSLRQALISNIRFPMRFREWLRSDRPGLCQDAFAHCSL